MRGLIRHMVNEKHFTLKAIILILIHCCDIPYTYYTLHVNSLPMKYEWYISSGGGQNLGIVKLY